MTSGPSICYSGHIMLRLQDLEDGKYVCGDSHNPPLPPDGFDVEKFDRGRQFFREHIFSCVIAMLFSLIIGMSVPVLLQALVFTGASNTPRKSLKRYMDTFRHVALWHYGNVWDKNSEAYKSIQNVRKMHSRVRIRMEKQTIDDGSTIFLSQYDMGVVQSGFMGFVVMYHEHFGMQCTPQEIDDYVYFWYGIGHLLGIEKKYNICGHGMSQAFMFCKDIEEIVIKNLRRPSPHFKLMTDAAITGFANGRTRITLLSFPVIQYLSLEAMSRKQEALGCISTDKFRYYLWKCLISCIKYFPRFRSFVRTVIEKTFNLVFI